MCPRSPHSDGFVCVVFFGAIFRDLSASAPSANRVHSMRTYLEGVHVGCCCNDSNDSEENNGLHFSDISNRFLFTCTFSSQARYFRTPNPHSLPFVSRLPHTQVLDLALGFLAGTLALYTIARSLVAQICKCLNASCRQYGALREIATGSIRQILAVLSEG